MAFIHTNFFSPTLGFNTDINVFIPTPNSDEILNHKASDYFYDGARFQLLYLLHGAYGDYTDWMRLT
ncbi:MAG TPA: esterase family protein, partial [Clostridia bacterium]|nr:esterase family protein [Clostridia bacterium]